MTEHGNFKNSYNYKVLHKYMKVRIKKPKVCEICKKKKPIDLAFKNHNAKFNTPELYTRNVDDWYYLCRSCHMKEDKRINNLKQYQTTCECGLPLIAHEESGNKDFISNCKKFKPAQKGCGKIIPNDLAIAPKRMGWQCGQYYDALKKVILCPECNNSPETIKLMGGMSEKDYKEWSEGNSFNLSEKMVKRKVIKRESTTKYPNYLKEEDVKTFIQELNGIEEKYNEIIHNLIVKKEFVDIYLSQIVLKQKEINNLLGEELI